MKKTLFTSAIIIVNFLSSFAQSYPEMVTVKGGTFTMGDTEMEAEIDAKTTHQVTLKTFKIAKKETTVAQWKTFCIATGRIMPEAPSWGWVDSHPIVRVNHDDAIAYCKWLGEEYGGGWRLPTEAEWEFAARGGNKSSGYKYSGSNNLDEVAWYVVDKTQSVGTKKANELGIFDMSGNVSEWCQDWYFLTYGSYPKRNPKGPIFGTYRIVRGGSFMNLSKYCRVAYRNATAPTSGYNDCGFRVVLSQ